MEIQDRNRRPRRPGLLRWLLFGLSIVLGIPCLCSLGLVYREFREGYTARVERVDPPIPGLRVESFPSANGALKITNETVQDVYIWRVAFPLQPWAEWQRIPPGQYLLLIAGVEYRVIDLNKQPRGLWPGQVMKQWTVLGRVGDMPFSISGVTVYDPLPP